MTNPIINELATLIGFPTVSNRPVDALASYVADRMEAIGFTIERFRDPVQEGKYNVVARCGPDTDGGLVLSGHMDVVPTENQPWTCDPFVLTPRDGRLHGRGTADMKGFIAASLHALARIRTIDYQHPIVCIWTYDEEVGCLGSAHLAEHLKTTNGPIPSACLIGEPTDFHILRMHPGHTAIEVTLTGQAAHSSRPDLGRNAIEKAARVIYQLGEFSEILKKERHLEAYLERPWVAFNTATIRGGSAVNIVPDKCVIEAGFRPLPGMDGVQITQRIEQYLRDTLKLNADDLAIRMMRSTPPMMTEDNTALHHTLCAHSPQPTAGAATFATDGGNLEKLGCKPLVFGPGSITVAHMADEYIEAKDLIRAVDVIESVVRTHCC